MTKQPLRLLVVDDEASLRNPLAKHLRDKRKYNVETAATFVEAVERALAAKKPFDVALIDDMLVRSENEEPESLGVALMQAIRDHSPSTEFILFTGWGLDAGLEALRAGAFRFVRKPFDLEELGFMIEHAAEYRHLKETAHEKRILERLMESGTALLSGLGLADVLHTIARGVQSIGFDRVRLYLLSDDRRFLIGRAHAGMDSQFLGLSILVDSDPYMQDLLNLPEPTIFERKPDQFVPYEQVLAKEALDQWACVPLMLRGEVIGKLSVDNQISRRPLVKEELGPVAVFAAQAAAAIENARLREEEQRASQKAEQRTRNLEAIQRVSYALKTSLDLEQTLITACQAAVELFGVDHSGMVMFEPNYTKGQVVAEYPSQTGIVGTEIPLAGVPQEESLVSTREPIVVEDVAKEVTLGPVHDILLGFRIRSSLIVPVVFQDKLLGSFSLDAIDRQRMFSTEEVDLCKIFASQVAPAIANAQLFAKTIRNVEQLETLRQTTLDLTSQLDRNATLDAIIQRAVSLLGAKGGGIYEYSPEREELTVVADHGHQVDLIGRTLKLGEGMAGRLVQSREPHMIVCDYTQWPDRADVFAQTGPFGAVIEVPLTWKDRIVGVLYVDDEAQREFSAEDTGILRLFADHAAIALVNAKLVGQLTDRAAYWRHLVSDSPIAVVANDRLGNVIGFNEKAQSILGYQPEEILGRSIELIYNDTQEPHDIGNLLRASVDGRIVNYETLLRTKQGEMLPIRLAVTWLHDELGEQIGVVGYFEDLREIREAEQRLFAQSAIFDRLTDSIQSAEDLDKVLVTVLTGVTASFGLGFNRAALFLLDPTGTKLIGRKAIGHLKPEMAWADWADIYSRGPADFKQFLEQYSDQPFPTTPLEERIHGLELSLGSNGNDVFFEVIDTGHYALIEDAAELIRLPRVFREAFEPQTPLVVVALRSRNRVIGLLVAGNKFSQRLITHETVQSLITFANTAAIAIDNKMLQEEARQAHQRIEASFKASTALVSSRNPDEVLRDIVAQARRAAGAAWVSVVLIDDEGRPQDPVLDGTDKQYDIKKIMRADGISMEVMRTGRAVPIENVEKRRGRVNPVLLEDQIAAALCLPLSLQDKRIGVMWVHYHEVRNLPEYEINALQLYANQATIAYDSARLLDQASRARKTAGVVARVMISEDLDATLRSVARGTVAALNCDAVALFAYDQNKDKMRHPPTLVGVWHPARAGRFPEVKRPSIVYDMLMRDAPCVVQDTTSDPQFRDKRFAKEEKIASCAVIPLKAGADRVGVMFVNFRTYHRFTNDELTDIQLLADQAAMAIRNAQLYEGVNRRATVLQALYEAGQTVTASLVLDEILYYIAEQACHLVSDASLASIMLANGPRATYVATHPREELVQIHEKLGRHIDLVHGMEGRIGVMGRAIKTGESQRVGDVLKDPDYLMSHVGTHSELAVPIKISSHVVGAINMEHPNADGFDDDDLHSLELLAAQAGIAIQNARQFRLRESLLKVGEKVAIEGELYPALEVIAESVKEAVNCDVVSLFTYDEAKHEISYPSVIVGELRKPAAQAAWELITKDRTLSLNSLGERSVIRALLEYGSSRFARYCAKDPILSAGDFVVREEIVASAGVLLKSGDRVIGILFINYRAPHDFSDEEEQAIGLFAVQAAMAIKNARTYEELRRTKGLVGARTALAWMGMASSAWRHTIDKHALTIREQARLIRRQSSSIPGPDSFPARLDMIERLADQILEKPITPPLAAEDGVESVPICDFLRTRTKRLWDQEPYSLVSLLWDLDPALEEESTVRANPQWLRWALDILIDNAVEAMADQESREMILATQRTDEGVQVSITDKGPGIPPEIFDKLFIEPIDKKKGTKGLGRGLLVAQAIVQTYGGEIRVRTTGPSGTTMVISLPLEK